MDKCNNIFRLIEFDGKQHFKPFGFGSGSEETIEKEFQLQQKRDEIKNQYCLNNGIDLIRIPHWEINNIEEILVQKLSPLI